jgi:hypothetical protein
MNRISEEESRMTTFLKSIWEDYCRTDDLNFLVLFIRLGGDIDDRETRDLIADLLEKPPPNPGGSIPMKNIWFYEHVRMLMDDDGMGITKAIKYLSERLNISVSGGWARYNAGEKISQFRS